MEKPELLDLINDFLEKNHYTLLPTGLYNAKQNIMIAPIPPTIKWIDVFNSQEYQLATQKYILQPLFFKNAAGKEKELLKYLIIENKEVGLSFLMSKLESKDKSKNKKSELLSCIEIFKDEPQLLNMILRSEVVKNSEPDIIGSIFQQINLPKDNLLEIVKEYLSNNTVNSLEYEKKMYTLIKYLVEDIKDYLPYFPRLWKQKKSTKEIFTYGPLMETMEITFNYKELRETYPQYLIGHLHNYIIQLCNFKKTQELLSINKIDWSSDDTSIYSTLGLQSHSLNRELIDKFLKRYLEELDLHNKISYSEEDVIDIILDINYEKMDKIVPEKQQVKKSKKI